MTANAPPILLPRTYYSATMAAFLASTSETVLGALLANSEMAVEPPQCDAWLQEIAILKTTLHELDGTLFREFNIPRMGKRTHAHSSLLRQYVPISIPSRQPVLDQ